jgi:hypothetical protein
MRPQLTKRLTKNKHLDAKLDIPKTPMVNTKDFVSMDQFKEMIDIEREFGTCLEDLDRDIYPKRESPWVTIFTSLTGRQKAFDHFK